MASAATRKGSKARPFFGALLFGCVLFLASGVAIRFADIMLFLGQGMPEAFLILGGLELLFRGILQEKLGAAKNSLLFFVFLSLVYSSLLPASTLGVLAFVAAYSSLVTVLREMEDVWTCVLASWAYLAFALLATTSPYFASAVLSLFFMSFALYWEVRGRDLRDALGELGVREQGLFKNVFIGLITTAALLVSFAVLALALKQLGMNDLFKVERYIGQFPDYMLVLVSTLGPFSEELFFRGLLLPVIGAFGSSAVFALSHFVYGSNVEVLGAFIIGYFYCWLYRKTGSLIPAIVSHAVFNAVSVIMGRI